MVSGSDVLIKNSHVEANEAAVRRCQRNDATIAIYSTVWLHRILFERFV